MLFYLQSDTRLSCSYHTRMIPLLVLPLSPLAVLQSGEVDYLHTLRSSEVTLLAAGSMPGQY